MKQTVTITFDSESRETEMVAGNTRYKFIAANMTMERPPEEDQDAMDESRGGYVILKPGSILNLIFTGTIVDQSTV